MPRARCTASIEAEKRYKAGSKLVEIARHLKVPEGTVRRWKSTQNWDQKTDSERSLTKTSARKSNPSLVKYSKTVQEKIVDKVEENDKLTPAQKDFCIRFVDTCNATMAYVRAYGCTYNAARRAASRLLTKEDIQEEVKELRKLKHLEYGNISGDDVIAMHMKIAFANIHDYIEFQAKTVPVFHNGVPVTMTHPKTKEQIPLTKTINVVKLRDSSAIDGQLITEVSEGREGAKIKLADRQKSLDFLARYFELNPMDKHRKEYDSKRYDLEVKRFERGEAEQSITGIEDMTTLAELLNDDNTDVHD